MFTDCTPYPTSHPSSNYSRLSSFRTCIIYRIVDLWLVFVYLVNSLFDIGHINDGICKIMSPIFWFLAYIAVSGKQTCIHQVTV